VQFLSTNSLPKLPKSSLPTRFLTRTNIGSFLLLPHAARVAVCPSLLSISYFSVHFSLTIVSYSHLPAFPLIAVGLDHSRQSLPIKLFGMPSSASFPQPSGCVGKMANIG
jgi:hypothetical protein